MMTDETTTTKKAGLTPIEVGAGAGAAVITAFASSYLGTAGTLTGAAIASVVGTVSTAALRNSAETSAQRLRHTTTRLRDTRVHRVGATDIRPVEADDIDPYGPQLFGASDWIDPEHWIDPDRPAGGPPSGIPNPGPRPLGTRPPGATGAADRGSAVGATGAIGAAGTRANSGETERFRTDPWGTEAGLAGATGAEPGSAWGAPTERLGDAATGRGQGPDGTRVTGPVPRGPYGPGLTEEPGAGDQGSSTGRVGADGTGPGRTAPAPGRRIRPRWVVLGAGAAAAFALALGAITGIEAVAGKPLSGLAGTESGGGTTIGRATGADSGSGGETTPSPTPTPTTGGASPTEPAPGNGTSPSGGVTETAPSEPPASSDSPAPSPTQPAPTQAPGGSPSP